MVCGLETINKPTNRYTHILLTTNTLKKVLTINAYGRLFAAYMLKKLGFKHWYKPLINI